MNKTKLINTYLIVFIVIFFFWQVLLKKDKLKPVAKETIQSKEEYISLDGKKHIIPLSEIIDSEMPKDSIPPIDSPDYDSVDEAETFLKDTEFGIAIELEGVKRFYPLWILAWHQVVNDVVANTHIVVTYCPLCYSTMVFEPVVSDRYLTFSTSGKVWNSNFLMYDRDTESLWVQLTGQCVAGEMTGARLRVINSSIVQFAGWKKLNPQGSVLSRKTGLARNYEKNPYESYYTTQGTYFPVSSKDNRLNEKDLVFGTLIDNVPVAYSYNAVKKQGEIEKKFTSSTISAEYVKDVDTVIISKKQSDGKFEGLSASPAFWFCWSSIYPHTELIK